MAVYRLLHAPLRGEQQSLRRTDLPMAAKKLNPPASLDRGSYVSVVRECVCSFCIRHALHRILLLRQQEQGTSSAGTERSQRRLNKKIQRFFFVLSPRVASFVAGASCGSLTMFSLHGTTSHLIFPVLVAAHSSRLSSKPVAGERSGAGTGHSIQGQNTTRCQSR